MTCKSCNHFLPGALPDSDIPPYREALKDGVGICRRQPPAWVPSIYRFGFPAVHEKQDCGKYDSRVGIC